MAACPSCHVANAPERETCAACGVSLVGSAAAAEGQDLFSATLPASASLAASGGGGVVVARSNPTPGPSRPGSDSMVGARLAGRYEVTRKIGEGGMGAVYEARHLLIGKRVAVKVLLDKYAQKADVVARLQQEARLASSIGHEHIVDITDFGETDAGLTFVVMEFLEGESLAQLLAREGPLPPGRAVSLVRQVASALGAAHAKGIVHRDIKPENVFLVRRGDKDFVKVVDFGISKAMRPEEDQGSTPGEGPTSTPRLTQTGMVLGTPLYMSPEQARGEDLLDHRVDVYALGVIVYELITGEVPFRGTNYLSIISQVISTEPRRPSEVRPDLGITPALEAVILKSMAKDRTVRYSSMTELDGDLAKLQTGDEVGALSGAHLTGTRGGIRPASRGRILVWSGVVLAVVGAVALAAPRLMPERDRDRETSVEAAPAEAPAQPAAAPPPADPAPSKLEMIHVGVSSEPPGAKVYWESALYGTTPTTVELGRGDQKIELTLRLDGYEDAKVPFFPARDQEIPLVTLVKKKPARPGKKARETTAPGTGITPTTPARDRGPTSGGEIKPSPFEK